MPIDGGSLVALVNRTRRLRLTFSVSGWPFASGTAMPGSRVSIRRRSAPAKIPIIAQAQLTPELSGIIRERHLTLDQMLAEAVVVWNDVPITAKGLISYVANIGGVVHLGEQPKGRVQEALHTFGGDLSFDGYPIVLAGLWDVGEVAISGLQPLRAAIEAANGDCRIGI